MTSSIALAGVHVALATPVAETGDIDGVGLHTLVDRVISGGVDAVCPTGSTGEGPRLTSAQRISVARAVCDQVGTSHSVIPAVSAFTVSDVVAEIAAFAELGATAALVPPPSYYPMPATHQRAWYTAIAEQTALPIVLYNIPAMTSVSIAIPVIAELAEQPTVIGMKDSSRDMEYLQNAVRATRGADFGVLTGIDTLLRPALDLGAIGTIAASANLVPELGRKIFDAVRAGDHQTARAAQDRLIDVVNICRVGVPPTGWKVALEFAGVCSSRLVPPTPGLAADEVEQLTARLAELELP